MSPIKESRWQYIRWTARLISLGPIIFLLGEFLFPHGDSEIPVPWVEFIPLGFMALSVIGLILAWRWERIGGWLSLGSLAAFLILFWIIQGEFFPWVAIIPLSFIVVPAVLFLLCCRHARQMQLGMA